MKIEDRRISISYVVSFRFRWLTRLPSPWNQRFISMPQPWMEKLICWKKDGVCAIGGIAHL